MSRPTADAPRALSESYPAVPASVPEARRAVVRLAAGAGADRERVEAIGLATSEALNNVVLHAYPGAAGPIHVSAALDGESLAVTVADEGRGIRPRLDRPGTGIGLALIAQMTDRMTIAKRPDGGTELQMRFALYPSSKVKASIVRVSSKTRWT